MTTDQKKDKILEIIDFASRPFSTLYKIAIDKNEEDDEGVIFPLMDEMIYDGLIKIADGNDPRGEFVSLDIKGKKIKEAGGYLKVKADLIKKEEEKRQRTVNIKVGDIGQVNYGTVHGSMTSDSSQNKTTNIPAKADSSMSKKIFIGVVVGLIVAIILYYLFGIK